jgi:O-antigen/teichoic acid export membrane protein
MLLSSIGVARLLGKVDYGALGLIQITTAMFQVFAGFGLGMTATKFTAEYRVKDPARVGRILGLSTLVSLFTGLLVGGAVYIFADLIAAKSLHSSFLAPMIRVSAWMLVFGAINGAQVGALSGLHAFSTIARINVASGLASFPLLVGGAYFYGLRGAVWALVLSLLLNSVLSQIAIRRELRLANIQMQFRGASAEAPLLWRFSLPAILCGAMVAPVNWICGAMLARRPDGLAQMGIFNAANQWFSVLLFLPMVLEQVSLPMISERIGAQDSHRSRRLLMASIAVNFIVVTPMVLLGILASPLIMRFYGPGFAGNASTLIVVLLTAGLFAIQAPIGQLVAAADRMWLALAMNTGWAITMLIATRYLVARGAVGLASARLIAYLIHSIWTLGFAYQFVKAPRNELVTEIANPVRDVS